ncbi:CFC-like protein [Mya arenaria]|uniref:CFC-like protein n=1 Tax=Mya arenaria TaxID=6604 RepID=A0ABY7FV17_MYAAR|nr:CFC-like protein [Mya arenaria]
MGGGLAYNPKLSLNALKEWEVYMPYAAKADCIDNLSSAGRNIQLTDNMFCAGRLRRGAGDVCPGDTGGGLLMEAVGEFRWVLTGVVSFGPGGCNNWNFYSVFTNVGNFYEWINDNTHFTEEEVDTSFLDESKK